MKILTTHTKGIANRTRVLTTALAIGGIFLVSNEGWSQQRGKKAPVKKAPVKKVVVKAPPHAVKPAKKAPVVVKKKVTRGRLAIKHGKWSGVTLLTLPTYKSHSAFQRLPIEVAVQLELKSLGYYRGPIDGDIGRGSISAITSYQRDNGLVATRSIDRALLKSLNIID